VLLSLQSAGSHGGRETILTSIRLMKPKWDVIIRPYPEGKLSSKISIIDQPIAFQTAGRDLQQEGSPSSQTIIYNIATSSRSFGVSVELNIGALK
jgi:hypothetical protein